MATKKGTHRTGKTTRRSSSLTRRAILSGLGAGLVVPALQADVTPTVQSATKSPTLDPQASYDLNKISELTISISYNAKAKAITISACK